MAKMKTPCAITPRRNIPNMVAEVAELARLRDYLHHYSLAFNIMYAACMLFGAERCIRVYICILSIS